MYSLQVRYSYKTILLVLVFTSWILIQLQPLMIMEILIGTWKCITYVLMYFTICTMWKNTEINLLYQFLESNENLSAKIFSLHLNQNLFIRIRCI